MSAELAAAVRAALAHVRAHPHEMTRADVDRFHELAREVCALAVRAGWGDRLPRIPELAPALQHPDLPELPPAQYESRLYLPGDWAPAEPGPMTTPPCRRPTRSSTGPRAARGFCPGGPASPLPQPRRCSCRARPGRGSPRWRSCWRSPKPWATTLPSTRNPRAARRR